MKTAHTRSAGMRCLFCGEKARPADLAWLPRPDADDPCPAPVPAAVANRSAEAYAFTVAEELAPGDFLRIRTP